MSSTEAVQLSMRTVAHDLLTLCLRLCLEPADSHAPETMAVLERWRKAWEEAAGGMDFDQALALCGLAVSERQAIPETVRRTLQGIASDMERIAGQQDYGWATLKDHARTLREIGWPSQSGNEESK